MCMHFTTLLNIVAATLLIPQLCWAIPLDQFYPFGDHVGDQEFSRLSASSPQLVALSDAFFFYDSLRSFNTVHVAANGIIVFDSNSSFHLTPQPFPVSGFPYIAPYWFDNDIFVNHSVDIESTVYYRIIGRSKHTTRASREIRRAFPNAKNFHPSSLVIVTWNIHNPKRNQSNMGNQFQCILASKGNLSFVIFHYADGFLQQSLDNGSKFEHPVDVKAQAGLNAGDDRFEMIIIGTDVSKTTNVGIPGIWMYQTNERTANKPTPLPLVKISTNNRPRMNKPLTLTCDVSIARGDTNRVDIIWSISKNDRQIKRTSNVTLNKFRDTLALYSDSLIIPSLSLYDTENNYQCQVLINSTVVKKNFTIILPIRLVNGATKYQGRVELFRNGKWGTLCGYHWTIDDATTVCRELGFGALIRRRSHGFFGESNGPFWFRSLSSVKVERTCKHHRGYDELNLMCGLPVRLTNGSTEYEGAVEVYYNGEWGAVCDNGWDINDANVVCNELYLGGAMNARRGSFYGQSSGQIWLDDLNCTGTERSIEQCPHNGWGIQNCSHAKTAGVKCTTVRLADGPTRYEGTAEVYHNNRWGAICDIHWHLRDGHVVCNQLGYGNAIGIQFNSHYGLSLAKVWLYAVHCTGNETTIESCDHPGWGDYPDFSNLDAICEDRRSAAGLVCAPAHQPNVTIQVTGEQIVGQSLVLECKIEAAIDIDSTVDIVWTTGNVEVRRVQNIPDHSLNNYSDFLSTPLLNDDNRRYQCEVITNTNPQVKADETVKLKVTSYQPHVAIQVTGEQIVGQSLVLECKIEAAIDINSTVDIVWTTGNNSEVRRVKNIPDHSLNNYSDFFSTPLLSRNDDGRRYQCEVVTNTSPQIKGSGSITLNVTFPIVVINAPDEQVLGEPLTLECKIKTAVDIDGTFNIIWTNSISEVRRVENISANLISNYSDYYTFPALSRSDDNIRYQCEMIINTNPPVSAALASITLQVRKRPQMIISPSKFSHRVTVGTQLLLYCAAEGFLTPTVQWYSNGVFLHPLQQPYQQLYLIPTDSPHTTVYTCIGRNHFKGVNHVSQANVTVIVEKICPTLKAPSHGRLTTSNDGEFAFFSCNRGYNIRGSDVLQCINGEWNMQPPTCQEIPRSCRRECNF